MITGDALQVYLAVNGVATCFNFVMVWVIIRHLDRQEKEKIK